MPSHLEKERVDSLEISLFFFNSFPIVKNYHSMDGKHRKEVKQVKNLTNSGHSFNSSIVPNIVSFEEQVTNKS